jgi:hypothetical protein
LPDSVYLSGPSFLLQNVYDNEQEYACTLVITQ